MSSALQKWADLLARDEIEISAHENNVAIEQGDPGDGDYGYRGWANLPYREIPEMKLIKEN
ncbi:hypothetical protein ACFORO_26010 [Amycolatopsis halotolerans]|uniref:Uncharacterized protein n=1 Tax=Amycolatopsis halotolerans TaxID=330083 RepID=A0ABV7QNJ3_9PSEU